MDIMTGMVDRSRTVDGVPTSLKDLGYVDVGLDVRFSRAAYCFACAARPR